MLSYHKFMLTIISLPSNFVTSTTAMMSDFFSDLSPITILIISVLLGALIIDIVVGALHRK
jgi:hypothetical protein